MSREIKFRAYNKNTNEIISWNQIGDDHWDLWNEFKSCDTIMQFTGLKDKNGVEIYEFDICTFYNKYSQQQYTRVVRYCPLFACFGLYPDIKEIYNYESDWLKIENVEVIGNIYQHPNLLES